MSEISREPSNSVTQTTQAKARHKWFPVLVIVLLGVWWARREIQAHYFTFFHFVALVFAALLISLWFLRFGGTTKRKRQVLVGAIWLPLIVWFALFRPVWNGDMGFHGWRPRFAAAPDRRLEQLTATNRIEDWHTTPQDFPRFLGNGYWAEVHGVKLDPDWQQKPPQEVWRREIGAGWSAFSVVGNYAITQEQRGDQELVTCYRVDTGEPVWTHADDARFDPQDVPGSLGDIGPRATPTILNERVFTQGGTGIVNCLDARSGEVVWQCDTSKEFDVPVLVWGKSGSPLVVDDMVVINVGVKPGGDEATSLVAFDLETGKVRWKAGTRQASYSSPIITELAGERQIVVINERWVTAHRPSDGDVLWEHPWKDEGDGNASCTQPMPVGEDRLLLTKGYGIGSSLLKISRDAAGKFAVEQSWQPPVKLVMKTKFSNPVIRDGFVYGLDDVLLECIELETGKVRWKNRRRPAFGYGQILLVGEHILVLSETGELALVEVSPEKYREVAAMRVLSDENITWNTPAFAPPFLLVRNGHEAACYRLPLE